MLQSLAHCSDYLFLEKGIKCLCNMLEALSDNKIEMLVANGTMEAITHGALGTSKHGFITGRTKSGYESDSA